MRPSPVDDRVKELLLPSTYSIYKILLGWTILQLRLAHVRPLVTSVRKCLPCRGPAGLDMNGICEGASMAVVIELLYF